MSRRAGNSMDLLRIAKVERNPYTGRLQANAIYPAIISYVVDNRFTQKMHIISGVAASNHMYNKTCHGFMLYKTVDGVDHSNDTPFNIMQNQPDISTDPREEGVPSVMCFHTAGTQVCSLSFKNFRFC